MTKMCCNLCRSSRIMAMTLNDGAFRERTVQQLHTRMSCPETGFLNGECGRKPQVNLRSRARCSISIGRGVQPDQWRALDLRSSPHCRDQRIHLWPPFPKFPSSQINEDGTKFHEISTSFQTASFFQTNR